MSRKRILRRRYSPPGAAPGTLTGVEGGAQPVISLVQYSESSYRETPCRSVKEAAGKLEPGTRAWVRVVGHDVAVVEEIGAVFGVHPLLLEDMMNVGQRPKVEVHSDLVFVVLQTLRNGANGDAEEEQVALVLKDGVLLTVEERKNDLFRPVEERLRTAKGRIRSAGADFLLYALLDAVVDYFFPLLNTIGDRIEEAETEMLDDPGQSSLEKLHSIKRELLRSRRAIWPTRDLVSVLQRGDSALIGEECRVFIRDVYDHVVQILDMVETFREMTTGLVDLYLSSVSNRMNEVMKVLTIIATIFIPLTFIAGLYGMNFDTSAGPLNMPELHWRLGYPFALGIMGAIAVLMLILFRRRGWL